MPNFMLIQASCAFRSEGWWRIQSKLGEGYLANACAAFPRSVNLVGGILERSLDLSCSESARLAALSDPGPLEFVEGTGKPQTGWNSRRNQQRETWISQASHRVAEVRRQVIWRLQNRTIRSRNGSFWFDTSQTGYNDWLTTAMSITIGIS
jgi:hypothetical protein